MEAEVKISQSIDDINRKDEFTGTVTKILLAGAVIDIGVDIPGIIHISQLQEEPVNRVEDVLEIGQTIDVWVKRVFPKKKRLELTMIAPLPLEWREIKEGAVVKGKVTRLEKYGAFIEIGAERPGLVHISELAHGYIQTPNDAVKAGDEVEVKVLSVNRRRKQIKLSMKALMDNPVEAIKKVKQQMKEDDKSELPIPTAMEMAWRQAQERSQQDNGKIDDHPSKKFLAKNNELDGILSRTLEHQVKTAA